MNCFRYMYANFRFENRDGFNSFQNYLKLLGGKSEQMYMYFPKREGVGLVKEGGTRG